MNKNLTIRNSTAEFLIFTTAPMVEDDATNLFEIIEDRTQINSTIITFSFL